MIRTKRQNPGIHQFRKKSKAMKNVIEEIMGVKFRGFTQARDGAGTQRELRYSSSCMIVE